MRGAFSLISIEFHRFAGRTTGGGPRSSQALWRFLPKLSRAWRHRRARLSFGGRDSRDHARGKLAQRFERLDIQGSTVFHRALTIAPGGG
jgi:hypothetical protein